MWPMMVEVVRGSVLVSRLKPLASCRHHRLVNMAQISQHGSSLLQAAAGITDQSTWLDPLASCSSHHILVNMAQASCKLQASQISQHGSSLLQAAAGITDQARWLKPLASCRHHILVNMAQPSLQAAAGITALSYCETSISTQKHHPYTGNLDSETSGDNKNAFSALWRCFRSVKIT